MKHLLAVKNLVDSRNENTTWRLKVPLLVHPLRTILIKSETHTHMGETFHLQNTNGGIIKWQKAQKDWRRYFVEDFN